MFLLFNINIIYIFKLLIYIYIFLIYIFLIYIFFLFLILLKLIFIKIVNNIKLLIKKYKKNKYQLYKDIYFLFYQKIIRYLKFKYLIIVIYVSCYSFYCYNFGLECQSNNNNKQIVFFMVGSTIVIYGPIFFKTKKDTIIFLKERLYRINNKNYPSLEYSKEMDSLDFKSFCNDFDFILTNFNELKTKEKSLEFACRDFQIFMFNRMLSGKPWPYENNEYWHQVAYINHKMQEILKYRMISPPSSYDIHIIEQEIIKLKKMYSKIMFGHPDMPLYSTIRGNQLNDYYLADRCDLITYLKLRLNKITYDIFCRDGFWVFNLFKKIWSLFPFI